MPFSLVAEGNLCEGVLARLIVCGIKERMCIVYPGEFEGALAVKWSGEGEISPLPGKMRK